MEETIIVGLTKKYRKTPAQILIRYQTQRGIIVIPKSVTKERIEKNIQLFDFTMTEEEMKMIDSMDCNRRLCAEIEWVASCGEFFWSHFTLLQCLFSARNNEHYPFKTTDEFWEKSQLCIIVWNLSQTQQQQIHSLIKFTNQQSTLRIFPLNLNFFS